MIRFVMILLLTIFALSCTTLKAEYNVESNNLKIDYTYSVFQSKQIKISRGADGTITVDTSANSEALIKSLDVAKSLAELGAAAAK